MSTSSRFQPYAIATLIVLGLTVYITGLKGDVFIDASKYAALSRYIAETGDLIHPEIMGEPYLQKPPFQFWISGLSMRMFGPGNVAYKLPVFIFFLIGLYATYRLTTLYYDTKTGLTAVFLLAFSQAMFLYNNDVHTDTLLTMLVTVSVWQLCTFVEQGSRIGFVLGFLAAGLGMITKGPVGLMVPLFAVGGRLLARKDWNMLFNPQWIGGLAIVILVIAPVLKGLFDMFGWEGIRFFFWTNNAGRITGSYAGNNRDILFYLHTLLYLLLPWTIPAIAAAFSGVRSLLAARFTLYRNGVYVTWAGILLYTGILSLARMKGPHYILPIIPLIAVVTADWIVRLSRDQKTAARYKVYFRIQNAITFVLMVLAILIPCWFFPTDRKGVWIFLTGSVAFMVWMWRNPVESRLSRLLLVSGMGIVALNFSINAVVLPELNAFNAGARAAEKFNRRAGADDLLFVHLYRSHEPAFYAKGRVLQLPATISPDRLPAVPCWVFTTQQGLEELRHAGLSFHTTDTLPQLSMSRFNAMYLFPDTRMASSRPTYLLKIN